MRIWAATRDENGIIADTVMEFDITGSSGEEAWAEAMTALCRELDLSRPVILKKHLRELEHFGHTAFIQADFLEPVDFKKLTVEMLREKKKKAKEELFD